MKNRSGLGWMVIATLAILAAWAIWFLASCDVTTSPNHTVRNLPNDCNVGSSHTLMIEGRPLAYFHCEVTPGEGKKIWRVVNVPAPKVGGPAKERAENPPAEE